MSEEKLEKKVEQCSSCIKSEPLNNYAVNNYAVRISQDYCRKPYSNERRSMLDWKNTGVLYWKD